MKSNRQTRALNRHKSQFARRALLKLSDDSHGLQTFQVEILKGEIAEIQRVQNYGLTSRPLQGAQPVVLSTGGKSNQYMALACDDNRHRPKNLAEGEVMLYTDEHGGAGHCIHLQRGNKLLLKSGASSIEMGPEGITLRAPSFKMVKS